MKTIVETSTKLSKYLLADDVVITATSDNITVGDPAQFIIAVITTSSASRYLLNLVEVSTIVFIV